MSTRQRIPSWAERSLQGLAYWIGWTHERYPFWPLSEGSMVAEARVAINAWLDSSQAAIAEVATRDLVSADAAAAAVVRKGRLDLVIVRCRAGRIPKGSQIGRAATALIEIKRGQASHAELMKDLVRLAQIVVNLGRGVRAFLIVGCESGRTPKAFVRKGVLVRGEKSIKGGVYFVRRVWRASQAKTSRKVSHSVVLVEVVARTF